MLTPDPAKTSNTAPTPTLPRLNAMDGLMGLMHESLQASGHFGLPQQNLIWLEGRVDVDALKEAIVNLSKRHPVIASTLQGVGGKARWIHHHDDVSHLDVIELNGIGDAIVLREVERLLASPVYTRREYPISFHLLRPQRGGDVLLLRWTHALMDGKAGELVLREIDGLYAGRIVVEDESKELAQDLVAEHISSHGGLARRLRCLFDAARYGVPYLATATLAVPGHRSWEAGQVRITVRELDSEQTRCVMARSKRIAGFENPTPLMLAVTCRAFRQRLNGRHQNKLLYTHVPVGLRAAELDGATFHNLQTYIPVKVWPGETVDLDGCARTLNARFREGFRLHADIAFLQSATLMNRWPRIVPWAMRRLDRRFSFVFGHHGPVVDGLEKFCGLRVARVLSGIPPAVLPPGISLATHTWAGRLQLIMVAVPQILSPEHCEAFLDTIVVDLLDEN